MKLIITSLVWFFVSSAVVVFIIAATRWQGSTDQQVRLPPIVQEKIAAFLNRDLILQNENEVEVLQEDEYAAALPATTLEMGDARPQLVAQFLERYHSPMQPYDEYGVFFVELADRYQFDFRLLPAISMQESGLCKSIPEGSYNCLGLGIHARGTWVFTSYKENFEAAAKILKKNYIDKGLTTPVEIMSKYTPSSNGSWASSVNQWMAEMRYNDKSLGKTLKTDASVLEFVESADTPATSSEAAQPSVNVP